MDEKISKSRVWAIVTIILISVVVALGIGLGVALKNEHDKNKLNDMLVEKDCPSEPVTEEHSSSRLTADSPLYVKPTNIKEGFYRYGTVATDAPICSTYGMNMMLRGGSTVDAAIAASLCTGVYHPQSCGIGGGFFMTYYKRSTMNSYAIMAREMAPGSATQSMYVDETVSSTEGGMSIGIPGEVKGLYEAWKLGGRLPWHVLFKPSIQMCEEGFSVGKPLHNAIQESIDFINRNDALKSMLTNPATGKLVQPGEKLKLPKLAETFKKIAADPQGFYNGSLASEVALDIAEAGGIITEDDLDKYTAAVKDPLSIQLSSGNFTVFSPPPPSSGAVLLFILNILNGYAMTPDDFSTVDKGVETFHRITEAFKHGFSARTNLGDMDQEDQEFKENIHKLISNMTSLEWGAKKRAKILHDTQDTAYYEPTYNFTISDAGTSHISVLGADGDAVSMTNTINRLFGSKVVGRRTGIVFNNEMDDFSTPGTVNSFQVPASPANFIKPYKRPLSSMSPTIVVDEDGDVKLVTGSAGGPRIISSIAQNIIHILWLKLGLKESIEYPRIHHQLLPPELRIEEAMPKVIQEGLLARGHKFDMREKMVSVIQAVMTRNKKSNSVQNVMDKKMTEIFSYSDPYKYGAPDGV